MATTYTPQLRLTQPAINDPTTKDLWGSFLNTDMALVESAITGTVTVDLTGLTSYSLTANNGAADQSRPFGLILTGTLPGTCTVTIQAVIKFGLVKNESNKSVILTTGSGDTMTLLAGATFWTPYVCDGTNVDPWWPVPNSRGQRFFTSSNTFASTTTATWQVPTNVGFATFDITGAGNHGGAGSASQPGGGSGGAGYVYLGVPTIPGETFTMTFNYGFVSVTSASGDINVTAAPGTAGTDGSGGGAGGAGGGATLTAVSRAGLAYYDLFGQAGLNGVVLSSGVHAGGAGGNSGSGYPGTANFLAAPSNSAQAQSAIYSGGACGGVGTGSGGNAGNSRVIIAW